MVTQSRALVRATAAETPRADAVEQRLRRFRSELQIPVRAMAARHPWIADLAVSFPALLFALAVPRVRDDGIVLMATGGAPLPRLAAALGVPLWMRAFPPEAFNATPLPALPDNVDFRRRIANHLPRRWGDAPAWPAHVANAWRWGDEAIALWFAREAPMKVRQPRWARMRLDVPWRLNALWAWFSQRHDAHARSFIDTPWSPAISWSNAARAAADWRAALSLPLFVGEAGLEDMWLEPAVVDGFMFTPLRTPGDLDAEAHAMSNCVRSYASSIADNGYRVWSMRRDGERIATLALMPSQYDAPFANILELAGPANRPAPIEAWRAARRWLVAHDDAPIGPERFARKTPELDAVFWRKLWRPYWLAKRTIPAWLPLTPSEGALSAL